MLETAVFSPVVLLLSTGGRRLHGTLCVSRIISQKQNLKFHRSIYLNLVWRANYQSFMSLDTLLTTVIHTYRPIPFKLAFSSWIVLVVSFSSSIIGSHGERSGLDIILGVAYISLNILHFTTGNNRFFYTFSIMDSEIYNGSTNNSAYINFHFDKQIVNT